MTNLLKVLLASIKAKITPIWTKIRLFMTGTFWQSKIITFIRTFLVKLFDIRPRHGKDYFTTRRWMISRRLCYAAVVVLGLLSLYFILVIVKPFDALSSKTGQIKTYKYNSLALRFIDSDVRIKAKSGYIAYEGAVSDGACNGQGKLYDDAGNLVYSGAFENSKYNGTGTF